MDKAGGKEKNGSWASGDRGRAEDPSLISERFVQGWGTGLQASRGRKGEDSQDRVDRTGDPYFRVDCSEGTRSEPPSGGRALRRTRTLGRFGELCALVCGQQQGALNKSLSLSCPLHKLTFLANRPLRFLLA